MQDIRYGIAAQIALFEFLKDRLQGIDFYLVSPEGESYPLDVSFRDKPERLTLVMEDAWFTRQSRKSFGETGLLAVDPTKAADIRLAVARAVIALKKARP